MNLRTMKKQTEKEDLFLPFCIGKNYIFRTVNFANVGKIKRVIDNWIILSQASWIVDTGNWSECLKTGKFKQTENFKDDVFINIDSIIDATPFYQKLPSEENQ